MKNINLIEKYVMVWHKLKVTERELEIFELRNGLFGNDKHTFREIGEKFAIGPKRAHQLHEKVKYYLESYI